MLRYTKLIKDTRCVTITLITKIFSKKFTKVKTLIAITLARKWQIMI